MSFLYSRGIQLDQVWSVLDRSDTIFSIVRLPGCAKFVLSGDPLYIRDFILLFSTIWHPTIPGIVLSEFVLSGDPLYLGFSSSFPNQRKATWWRNFGDKRFWLPDCHRGVTDNQGAGYFKSVSQSTDKYFEEVSKLNFKERIDYFVKRKK